MTATQTSADEPVVGAQVERPQTAPAAPPAHFRRNIALTIGEIVCFSLAMAFIDSSAVLPGFVTALTGSTVLLGLLPTVFQLGLGLPQLAAASFLSHRRRKMPFLIVASTVRNAPLFILAAVTWGRPEPAVLLGTFFACYALFAFGMGMESVAWLDIFAKICPADRRGQVFALARTGAGILAFGAGFFVSRILAAEGQGSRNYAALFLTAGLLLTAALLVFAFVREPIEAPPALPPADERAIHRRGRRVWREDGNFRRYVLARFLYGAHLVGIPFYLRFARDVIGIEEATIGRFISASVAGGLVANLLWGAVSRRFGNRWVARSVLGLAALLPLFVLLTPRLPQGAYLVVYVAIGAILAGEIIGWMNLLLGLTPPAERPLYISLQSTLLLPANLLPLLGGLALRVVPYAIFFPAITIVLATGCWLVGRIREAPPVTTRP